MRQNPADDFHIVDDDDFDEANNADDVELDGEFQNVQDYLIEIEKMKKQKRNFLVQPHLPLPARRLDKKLHKTFLFHFHNRQRR